MKNYTALSILISSAFFCLNSNAASPLQNFEEIVEGCKKSLSDPTDTVLPTKPFGPIRFITVLKDISYDVKKTDSLVTPYTAYIKIVRLRRQIKGDSEEQLRQLPVDTNQGDLVEENEEIRFSFQKENWVTSGSTSDNQIVGKPRNPMVPKIEYTREAIQKQPMWRAPCVR